MIWGKFLGEQMVNSGSTIHLRTFASYIPDERRLFVYVMNMLEESRSISLEVEGYQIKSLLQAWELVGKGPEDVDPLWQEIEGIKNTAEIAVSGTSITVFELRIGN